MTYHTSFRCYGCKKYHYTKQLLSPANGHLYCFECIPPAKPTFFRVEYKTKRGLEKSTTLKVDTEQEAREYTLTCKKFRAYEIVKVMEVK